MCGTPLEIHILNHLGPKFRQSRLAVVEGFEKGSTTAAAWIYMSQIHAHRFGLGYSIGSAGPNNAKVQNLYNQG